MPCAGMAYRANYYPDRIRCLQRCLCAVDAGADGYLLKDSDPEVLLEQFVLERKAAKSLANASIST